MFFVLHKINIIQLHIYKPCEQHKSRSDIQPAHVNYMHASSHMVNIHKSFVFTIISTLQNIVEPKYFIDDFGSSSFCNF